MADWTEEEGFLMDGFHIRKAQHTGYYVTGGYSSSRGEYSEVLFAGSLEDCLNYINSKFSELAGKQVTNG